MNKGFAPVLVIIVSLVGVGLLAVGYFVGTNKLPFTPSPATTNTPMVSSSPFSSPLATLKPVSGDAKKDTIYLGTFQGEEVLFYIGGNSPASIKGQIYKTDNSGRTNIDFSDINDPKPLWTDSKYNVEGVGGFALDDNKNIYISLLLHEKGTEYTPFPLNKIVKISLVSVEVNELWSHQVDADSQPGGAAYIKDVTNDGKYLSTERGECYACDGGLAGVMILNTETGKTKYIEDIGNVQMSSSEGEFTYQKLAPFKEPCGPDGGYGCDEDNNRTLMKPAGEVYSADLP